MALVSRDPFARTELHKRQVPANGRTCEWCGSCTFRAGKMVLFEYRTESDGGRVSPHRGLFCSLKCHNAYHR